MPVAAAVLAFIICLTCYNSINSGVDTVSYIKDRKSEMLTVVNTDGAYVIDMSTGGYANFCRAYDEIANQNGTEIEKLILTHYHQYHPGSLKRLCETAIVREIYLPMPKSENEIKWYNEICARLDGMKTSIVLYAPGDKIELSEDCSIALSAQYYVKRSVHPMYSVTVTSGEESFMYLSAAIYESEEFSGEIDADHIVFGIHGPNIHSAPEYSKYDLSMVETVIIADSESQWTDELYEMNSYILADDQMLLTVKLGEK